MLKFGMVGAVAFVIDLGGYNVLVFGPHLLGLLGEGNTAGVLNDKPLTARIISASVATVVAWLGNRLWTFRRRRNRQASHELVGAGRLSRAGRASRAGRRWSRRSS